MTVPEPINPEKKKKRRRRRRRRKEKVCAGT
jgi:hypothetical protein